MKLPYLRELLARIRLSKQPPTPDNYVSLVLGDKVRIEKVTADLIDGLESLGGHEETIAGEICWVIPTQGDKVLGELLGKLRDFGVLFVAAPAGWPPAAVFRDLRERGYVDGSFQEVTWYGPGKWVKSSA